ncbi:MAG TPA: hypothetical protein VMW10_04640 [Alphaproteobacteria bacterium]|nr:hypothetical protein [Alphaproteobacteria bacterium]
MQSEVWPQDPSFEGRKLAKEALDEAVSQGSALIQKAEGEGL